MGRRLLSALVLIPAVLAVLWFDPWNVGVFVLTVLVTGGMLAEYRGLANERGARLTIGDTVWMWLIAVWWASLGLGWARGLYAEENGLAGIGLVALVVGAFAGVWWRGRPDGALFHVGTIVLGGVLLGWCFAHYAVLLHRVYGAQGLIVVLGAVWACDTAAYAVGRQFGRHPMAPLVSPRKTWEGAIAGLVGAVLACAALAPWLTEVPGWQGAVAGAVIGVTAQLSDLAESALKRDAGVKDSGRLIPGHGGLLDRIDSLILVMPVLYHLHGVRPLLMAGA